MKGIRLASRLWMARRLRPGLRAQHRGEKILVFRYRPKKRVRVRRGHRQYLTRLQILKISGDGFEYVKEEEEAPPQEIVEETAAEAAVAAVP